MPVAAPAAGVEGRAVAVALAEGVAVRVAVAMGVADASSVAPPGMINSCPIRSEAALVRLFRRIIASTVVSYREAIASKVSPAATVYVTSRLGLGVDATAGLPAPAAVAPPTPVPAVVPALVTIVGSGGRAYGVAVSIAFGRLAGIASGVVVPHATAAIAPARASKVVSEAWRTGISVSCVGECFASSYARIPRPDNRSSRGERRQDLGCDVQESRKVVATGVVEAVAAAVNERIVARVKHQRWYARSGKTRVV